MALLQFPPFHSVSHATSCRRLAYREVVRCTAKASSEATKKRVIIIGGSGRVGSSTASSLLALNSDDAQKKDIDLVIAGRDTEKGRKAVDSIGGNVSFVQCDIDNMQSLLSVLDGADMVVHTAGPFQRKESCDVLAAAIQSKVPYLDVCDDLDYSQRARTLHHSAAITAGIPAVTTAGIYPGVSNIMAAELVRLAREAESPSEPKSLRYSYYTAGSGGAGPTILATSYLLLGEPVLAYKNGVALSLGPYSNCREVDFGKKIGKKPVYLFNLPEVESGHRVLGVPTVSARFGTDPPIWNWAMELMVALLPAEMLRDRDAVQTLVALSDPLVRFVDQWAGEAVAMRVDLECIDGRQAVALYSHKSLSKCVGQSTAAFALAMLEGSTQPGVWFPEEEEGVGVAHRKKLLERASKGTYQFILNRSPWMIEETPKQLGFGLYF